MARVNTNFTSLRFAIESSVGVLPGSPQWRIAEFENISAFGAVITTVVRRPISQDRGRKKGTVVDLDSKAEFDTDLTVDAFTDFAEGFMFAEYGNVEFDLKDGTGTLPPPAVGTTDDFTIDAASALLAGKVQFNAAGGQSLVFGKGYTNAGNNGLHVLNVDLASTDTTVQVASTLVTETPPTNASLQVAGIRGDDQLLTVDGGLATGSIASADIDFTTLGLFVGQLIHVGSGTSAGVLQNAPQIAATTVFGYARVTAIAAGTLTLDKLDTNLGLGGAGTSGATTFDLMYGRFLRNVQVTADADDNRFLERTYQFEGSYPDLGGVGTDEYEYAIGNFLNEMAFNVPLTSKSTIDFKFIGTNSDDITPTRKTNAATAVDALRTTAFNTSSDIVSLTTDVISAASDVCFKSLTITILNNVSPEKCLGTLGALFMNSGLFEVNLEGQMLFTDKGIVNAIKNNTTLTFLTVIRNEDGAIGLDIPEMTFGGGGREYPVDATVLVNVTGASFTSNAFGYDVGISLFVGLPFA